jgi:Do/DeqQ family serine protease
VSGANPSNAPIAARRRATAALAWLLIAASPTALGQLVALGDGEGPTLAPLLRRVTPAVVNIAVVGAFPITEPLLEDPFFRRFEPSEQLDMPQMAAGSGVIVDARNGYVLTNHHVIENAEEIIVTLVDRRELRALVVGSDAETDIALLQIEAEGLSALPFGDSDALEVGDFVVAIGNPFGLGQTVTSGIVSALGSSGLGIEGYEDLIQTDASINPGNSGGALVDLRGRLVGINSAMLAGAVGSVGIGFAIPSNLGRTVMDQLVAHGEVRRGRLPVMAQDLTADLATALGLTIASGAVITGVEPGSSAERAGIANGDVITAVNGEKVETSADLRKRIGLMHSGETVELTAVREGRTLKLKVQITDDPEIAAPHVLTSEAIEGAKFEALKATDRVYGRVEGVRVAEIYLDSPAWRNGLRLDDVILGVNRRPVTSVDELAEVVLEASPTFALHVLRDDMRMYVVVR